MLAKCHTTFTAFTNFCSSHMSKLNFYLVKSDLQFCPREQEVFCTSITVLCLAQGPDDIIVCVILCYAFCQVKPQVKPVTNVLASRYNYDINRY